MMADGSIIIETKLDNAKAEKELERLTKKIESLEKSIAKDTSDKSGLEKQANELVVQLDAAKAKLYEMQNAQRGAFSTEQINEQKETVNSLQKRWDALENQIERYDAKIKKATGTLNEQKAAAGEIADQLAQANNVSDRFGDTMSGVADRINKVSDRISRLASRVFAFTLITTALRGLRTWLGNVIKSNDEAAAAIARLKGALLTLAQPLVNVLIPAFTALVNILTAVITKIAEFVAMLTGKSIQEYASSAESLYNEMNAIEGVGEAAEEAAGSLAGFDEINQLSGDTSAAAGGTGGATDIEPDFSWTGDISDKLKEIADLILLIGAGLALWKIGSMLPGILGTIATTLGGILMTIGGLLLLWDGLTDAWENGVDWANLIEMIAGLAAAATGLYIAFGPIAAGIMLIVGGLAMLVTGFRDAMENGWNLQNTLLSIAGILATGLGIALIAGSWIPLLIAGIAAALLAFTVATGHGEELLEGIKEICQGFVDFFTGIFSGNIEKALGGIETLFSGLGKVITAIISGVRDTFLSFLDWLDEKTGGKLSPIIDFIKGLFTGLFDTLISIVSGAIEGIIQIFSGLVKFISGVFTADWDTAWEGIKDIFKGLWNGIVSILEGAVNLIIKGINWLISQLNKVSFTLPDWVPAIGGKSFGFHIPSISEVSIPRLATGAVIPPNREFLAVLGDQTSGTNIEAPLSTIEQALENVLARTSGMGGDINITVESVLDGKVVARNTVKHVNDMTRQAGKPVLLF